MGSRKKKTTAVSPELQSLRSQVHNVFDPLWQSGLFVSAPTLGAPKANYRDQGYKWLAHKLGMGRSACHVSLFDAATCHRALSVLTQLAAIEQAATEKE